jgi:hypothetical protein
MNQTKVMSFHPPARSNHPRTLKIETQGAVVWIEFREDVDGRAYTAVEVHPDGTRYGQDWRTQDADGAEATGTIRVVDYSEKA